jgi:hypothetical protein
METEILKSLVRRFKLNPTKENWILMENIIEDKNNCSKCNGPIFYKNSKILLSKEGKLKHNQNFPSCKSFKEIEGQRFYLKVCQDCLASEFPEYNFLNKSRVFNVMSKITQFAFDVPQESAKKFTQKTAVTLENFIKKYGEEEGKKRWDSYCKIQAETNTFDYKKEKYGWTEEQFKKYNKSRAVTLKNMVSKYGQIEGEKIFGEYVEKQKINGKTLEWFIKKHGKENGFKIFKTMLEGKVKGMMNGKGFSTASQEFFDKIDNYFSKNFTTYYHRKNKEFEIYVENEGQTRVFFLDYFIEELNTCIEFYGNYFHANPEKFKDPNHEIKFLKKHTVGEVWERDAVRLSLLREKKGIKTVVVWESDYYRNKDNEEFYKKIIKQCLEK